MQFIRRLALILIGAMSFCVIAKGDQDVLSWPRVIQEGDDRVTWHQPQIDDWDGLQLSARVAVKVEPSEPAEAFYGALRITADTVVDFPQRVVWLHNIRIEEGHFAGADKDAEHVAELVGIMLPRYARPIALDCVLDNLSRTNRANVSTSAPLRNDPPDIIFHDGPAILVLIDGKPELRPIEGTDLMYVINTLWNIFLDTAEGRYYLQVGRQWFCRDELSDGAWTPAEALPDSIRRIPADHPRACARQASTQPANGETLVPVVILRTRPTELICLDGEPTWTPIPGTGLLYNPASRHDMFLSARGREIFVSISGRWFKAESLQGPWTHVPADALPEGFIAIPTDHPKAPVRASVAGTPEAAEAIIVTRIPRLSLVQRDEQSLTVYYEGEPRFQEIPGTNLARAVNTSYDVVREGAMHYCCYQGVWYAAPSPTGPWIVCSKVPDSVYLIPPECPAHHLAHVRVQDANPETVVVGYTGGYVGTFPQNGAVVHGTGYAYPPFVGRFYYFPHPRTYGSAVAYSPYQAGFAYRMWQPSPYPHSAVRAGYNPTAGLYGAPFRVRAPYPGPDELALQDWGVWLNPARRTEAIESPTAPPASEPTDQQATAGEEDLYAALDGAVYWCRANNWLRYEGESGWVEVNTQDPYEGRDAQAVGFGWNQVIRGGPDASAYTDEPFLGLPGDAESRRVGLSRAVGYRNRRTPPEK